ncbi:MAG: TIGR01906 family membrane protein [Clostridiales Family XIII bacterium]|jgi:integral membrane protein (TIGR01906 family)|nr:TIGR01906 family membrane protein [Clostridiales Family XIII bacterium]
MKVNKKNRLTVTGVLAGICVAALILGAAVSITVMFRPLYYHDMKAFDVAARAGMSEEDVRANYDALIDYNLWSPLPPEPELEFPTLAMSENGRTHFREVREIFGVFHLLYWGGLIGTLIAARAMHKRRLSPRFLQLGAILAVAVPAAVGALLAAVGWDQAFVVLHGLLFDNDYWIFDAQTDPVITILPDAFFLHCLEMILAIIVCLAALLFFEGGHLMRKAAAAVSNNSERRMQNDQELLRH